MCTRPLAAIPDGRTENGKTKYRIVSYEKAFSVNRPENSFFDITFNRGKKIMIPCGKCKECRLRYAKRWSDRCMLELQLHKSSYFLTLTYDDANLPVNDKGYPTLKYEDFQLFMKRLRDAVPNKIRFYMCGEYGSHTKRSHYHAIIYGLELNDLVLYGRSELGDELFTSDFISDKWKCGQVLIGSVTPESCAYVARYVDKKQDIGKPNYKKLNIEPEFTHMSLKPGIGADLYSPEIFRKGYVCISTETGGKRIYPPKSFESRFELDCPDEYALYKRKKTVALEDQAIDYMQHTSKLYVDTFDDKEINLNGRTKSLVRSL